MRVTVNIERLQPTTSVGEGVKVSYTYTDFNKSIIDRIEEGLRAKIHDAFVMEVDKDGEDKSNGE